MSSWKWSPVRLERRVAELEARLCKSSTASARMPPALARRPPRIRHRLPCGGAISRRELAARLDPDIGKLQRLLQSRCRCADAKAAQFCANMRDIQVGLWQLVVEEGIEPTNNHAERLLRRGVLWRKNAFGCHSGKYLYINNHVF
jgi:hypothetical protein